MLYDKIDTKISYNHVFILKQAESMPKINESNETMPVFSTLRVSLASCLLANHVQSYINQ